MKTLSEFFESILHCKKCGTESTGLILKSRSQQSEFAGSSDCFLSTIYSFRVHMLDINCDEVSLWTVGTQAKLHSFCVSRHLTAPSAEL